MYRGGATATMPAVNAAQRIALVALVVGLLIVGGLDLLNRDTTTVSASGGVVPAANAAGAGTDSSVAANAATTLAPAAPAAGEVGVPITTAAPDAAVQQDDTGDEPDTVVKEDAPAPETLPGSSGTG